MNQQQFLQECGKSYPDAMAALGFFRQLVQQRFKAVVQAHITELAEVLGIPRQDLKLLAYANPDKPAMAVSEEVCLGCQAKRSENLDLYFCLYWNREPDEDSAPLGVVISVWIKDRNKREALAAKLDQFADIPPFDGEPWFYGDESDDIEFYMSVKEDDLPRADDKLKELCDYTIKFLKSLKGIAHYFQV